MTAKKDVALMFGTTNSSLSGLSHPGPEWKDRKVVMWPVVLSGQTTVGKDGVLKCRMNPNSRIVEIKEGFDGEFLWTPATADSNGLVTMPKVTRLPARDSGCFVNDEHWEVFVAQYVMMAQAGTFEPVFIQTRANPEPGAKTSTVRVNIEHEWIGGDSATKARLAREFLELSQDRRILQGRDYTGDGASWYEATCRLARTWAVEASRYGLPYYAGNPTARNLSQVIRGRSAWRVAWGYEMAVVPAPVSDTIPEFVFPKEVVEPLGEVVKKGWPAVIPVWYVPGVLQVYQLNGKLTTSCLGNAGIGCDLEGLLRVERSRFAANTYELRGVKNGLVNVPEEAIEVMQTVYEHLLRRGATGTMGDRIAVATELVRGYPIVSVKYNESKGTEVVKLDRLVGGKLTSVNDIKYYKVPERTGELPTDYWEKVVKRQQEEEEDEEEGLHACRHCRTLRALSQYYRPSESGVITAAVNEWVRAKLQAEPGFVGEDAVPRMCLCGHIFLEESGYPPDEWLQLFLQYSYVGNDEPAKIEVVEAESHGQTLHEYVNLHGGQVINGVVVRTNSPTCGCLLTWQAMANSLLGIPVGTCSHGNWTVHPVSLELVPMVMALNSMGGGWGLMATGEYVNRWAARGRSPWIPNLAFGVNIATPLPRSKLSLPMITQKGWKILAKYQAVRNHPEEVRWQQGGSVICTQFDAPEWKARREPIFGADEEKWRFEGHAAGIKEGTLR